MIETYESLEFTKLCGRIAELRRSISATTSADWPKGQIEELDKAAVYRWFVDPANGGLGWSNRDLAAAYVRLSSACLSSTFVLTQRIAALTRLALSSNDALRDAWLPTFLDGQQTATVGISHLTTSQRHLGSPAVRATPSPSGFVLEGVCPWVTGARHTAAIVVGAELEDAQQILAMVPTRQPGVHVEPGFNLIALSDSQTGPVKLNSVEIPDSLIIAGPRENVLASLGTQSTGSFQTSALALGLADSAIQFLQQEAIARHDLTSGASSLRAQHDQCLSLLLAIAAGESDCTNETIRTKANSLVLRATQAAMVAAKGAGFVAGHPVGRWCCEAMFFLVWSCPQAVRDANLCELAGSFEPQS